MRKGSVDGIGYHRVAISEACWTNCLLDIACWTLPPSRSLCLLPSAQVLKEDVLSEMPQCCCDACIKAHDRAAGVRSGKSLGSLGYGLGSAAALHASVFTSGTSGFGRDGWQGLWYIGYGLGAL